MIRQIFLLSIALIGVATLSPFAFLANLLRKSYFGQSIADYLHTIAVGLDQLGGSIIYSQEDYTISSYTHLLCMRGNCYACRFERFIDLLFGKGHCKRSYEREKREFQNYIKETL
ncbi:hypothetical protein NrS5_54 [Nitratiruptor phage NrS-5]|uniref:hypothetical protein n=1 Tax=unclassified Nitratiruptor TaxID=2624044 RepID=UPI00191558F4|nr:MULTISPECIES: hypothetical protein [unclassified Nitratiruptor]BCD61758.1 hypothetical protein NitYY0813_C0618 [Nitratiruptor sp. YY08-13]BCD65693.1 hypothetical protein NitYY0826_C0620 [Nitratiruptor sp. YY08-26]BCD83236.1 hypothetical protein NrS4_54 [Nitratiruptor phage NrS-4]BCD83295.1 hypothetical protein NrS5_54 [Nitratiruptor phage NrS-5]